MADLNLPDRDLTLNLSQDMSDRKIKESPIELGIDETAPFTLTVPDTWGTASSPTVVVKNGAGSSISSAVSGSPAVSSNVISFTLVGSPLVAGRNYRLEVKFTVSGGTLEGWGVLEARI